MPTVLRVRGYTFYFYSFDCQEPEHIHVDKAEKTAKFWLSPPGLARETTFKGHEVNEILAIIQEHHQYILDKWQEHCE